MNPRWGQFFVAQRGQFRMAFDKWSWLRPADLTAAGRIIAILSQEVMPFWLL
jgi:hypothetical protein